MSSSPASKVWLVTGSSRGLGRDLVKALVAHIIQVSSIGGRTATPGLAAYQASKWAVGGFSEVVAQEVAAFGVKVTILEPGGMRTDWAGSSMRVRPISAASPGISG